jgi:hypothetical protein
VRQLVGFGPIDSVTTAYGTTAAHPNSLLSSPHHSGNNRQAMIGREAFQKEVDVGRRLIGESQGRLRKIVAIAYEKVL